MPGVLQRWFVDWLGYLWCGPFDHAGEPEYKRFEGVHPTSLKFLWLWEEEVVGRVGSLPDMDEVPFEIARDMVSLHLRDAEKQRGRY